jgi:hypothetical protein
MVILTIIIGLANSIGLWIIGAAVWDCHMILFCLCCHFKGCLRKFEELKPIALIIAEKNKKEDDGNELFLSDGGRNKKYFK